jgi:microcystin-dependent protein
LGQKGGEQAHTLSIPELPTHVHTAVASSGTGTAPVPVNAFYGVAAEQPYLPPDNNLGALNAATIPNVGGSQAHLNMQPFLTLTFGIALQGIFPSQS